MAPPLSHQVDSEVSGSDESSILTSSSISSVKSFSRFSRRLSLSNVLGTSKRKEPNNNNKGKKKSVHFGDEIQVQIHPIEHYSKLSKETRNLLWLSKKDMLVFADHADEESYQMGDPDHRDPYVLQLHQLWEQCLAVDASSLKDQSTHAVHDKIMPNNNNNNNKDTTNSNANSATTATSGAVAVSNASELRGRGLESRLVPAVTRHRDATVKAVVEAQKSYRHRVGANNLQRKYKKLSQPAKLWAQALAHKDAEYCDNLRASVLAAMGA